MLELMAMLLLLRFIRTENVGNNDLYQSYKIYSIFVIIGLLIFRNVLHEN